MSEIPSSYCRAVLRQFGKQAGKDAIAEFKLILTNYAEKISKLASDKCEERKKKVITADDVTISLANLSK